MKNRIYTLLATLCLTTLSTISIFPDYGDIENAFSGICRLQPIPKIQKQAAIVVTEMTEQIMAEEAYYDSFEYVAMCVEAEAGNQGYLGKVYVTDCILNRMDRGEYVNFYDLIDERNQFECVSNGHIECIPTEETIQIVAQEIDNRTNSEIIYFREGRYHTFGTPCFNYKDHYFSK